MRDWFKEKGYYFYERERIEPDYDTPLYPTMASHGKKIDLPYAYAGDTDWDDPPYTLSWVCIKASGEGLIIIPLCSVKSHMLKIHKVVMWPLNLSKEIPRSIG
jgi:hypothetical protein